MLTVPLLLMEIVDPTVELTVVLAVTAPAATGRATMTASRIARVKRTRPGPDLSVFLNRPTMPGRAMLGLVVRLVVISVDYARIILA